MPLADSGPATSSCLYLHTQDVLWEAHISCPVRGRVVHTCSGMGKGSGRLAQLFLGPGPVCTRPGTWVW